MQVLLRGVGVDVEVETLLSSAERARDEGVWAKVRRSLMAMLQTGQESSATASRILKRTIRRDLQTSIRPPHAAQSTREQIQVCRDLSIRCSMRAQPSQLIAMHGILLIA